jgi:hypothetical protein
VTSFTRESVRGFVPRFSPMTRRNAAPLLLLALALLLAACGGGSPGAGGEDPADVGEPRTHHARLDPLNGSSVEGRAEMVQLGPTLRVRLRATGLEPRQLHVQHVHRLDDGRPGRCPSPSADADRDGRVSLDEALPAYGPVALKLEPFPRPDRGGGVAFEGEFELEPEIEPLPDRVIVLYGIDVRGVYDPTVPVACGRIR